LLENYTRAPVTFVGGEGCDLVDSDGRRYLDCIAGIAVCALGHAHPEITRAVAAQAARLVHASNLFGHEPAGELAGELARRSGFARVFFCNSGTEANEAAIKLARKHAFRRGETGRTTILACDGSFHGRTYGALAATGNDSYKVGFGPMPDGFAFTPFNDIAALERALDDRVAAFIVEPVQGESGVWPADPAFLSAARRLCDERGALLIFDEIQCGMGRLGTLFAFEHFGVRPDVVTMAKALANGLPIGAVLIDLECSTALQPGDHGSTFGGSPIPCAAALAHLRVRDELALETNVRERSAQLFAGLDALAQNHPGVYATPRGIGLLAALPVCAPHDAKSLVAAARDRGVLFGTAGDNAVRIAPPLIVGKDQITQALTVLSDIAAPSTA
jgi:predicted acetylornithine/succinylornithine family transaminase